MKAYKGFNKDMTCRGFQFKEGETYHEDNAELCKSGFHACEDPIDCFSYYSPAQSVYREVELDDVADERNSDDTKVCAKTIKVGAKIGIPGIVKAQFEYIGPLSKKRNTTAGDSSHATTAGYRSHATTAGDSSHATTAGDSSHATTAGDRSHATTAGDRSHAEVKGIDSVACALGYACFAKGCIGSAIVICERGEWNGKSYPLLAIKAAIVDGKEIKADTWYTLKDGEFVEVDG